MGLRAAEVTVRELIVAVRQTLVNAGEGRHVGRREEGVTSFVRAIGGPRRFAYDGEGCGDGGGVIDMDICPSLVGREPGREVRGNSDKSPAWLRLVSATTTLVGVVPLLGGVAEVR